MLRVSVPRGIHRVICRYYEIHQNAASLSRNREYRQKPEVAVYEELSPESMRNLNFEQTKRPAYLALEYFD